VGAMWAAVIAAMVSAIDYSRSSGGGWMTVSDRRRNELLQPRAADADVVEEDEAGGPQGAGIRAGSRRDGEAGCGTRPP